MPLNSIFKTFALAGIVLLSPDLTFGQCNSFVKKACMPNVEPFIHDGQMNTSVMECGQTAKLYLTFSSEQVYRILVCAQEILGAVYFRVLDRTNKVLFDSRENDAADFWDFKMTSTQQLIVEVTSAASDSPSSVVPSGCISVLVGFKKE